MPANSCQELTSRRMVARRPSRLAQRFRAAARRPQTVNYIGQAARRAAGRRVKPARSSAKERWADREDHARRTALVASLPMCRTNYCAE